MLDDEASLVTTRGRFVSSWSVLLTFAALAFSRSSSSAAPEAFGVADYFQVRRVAELALSGDGQQVAYVSEMSSLTEDETVRQAYVQGTKPSSPAREIDAPVDAHDVAWVPHSARLAFLSERSGASQLFTYDTQSLQTHQLTQVAPGIVRYRFAPRTDAVAFLTSGSARPLDVPHSAGLLVDVEATGYSELLEATKAARVPAALSQLFVQRPGMAPQLVEVPGDVQDFQWSADARWLSVTYVGSDVAPSVLRSYRTSIGVFDVAQKKFVVLASAQARTSTESGALYWGGEWLPNTRSIVVRRATEPNLWIGDIPFPEIAVVDATRVLSEQQPVWTRVELYPRDSRIIPERSRVLIETRVRARDTLLSLKEGRISNLQLGGGKSTSRVQFSENLQTAVFVSESLSSPPEVYVQAGSRSPRRLSTLNSTIADLTLPAVAEIAWRSSDGVEIAGWLLLPDQKSKRAWPLVTYIHGGPGYAFPDQFAPSMANWPYPLEALALRGVAIFIPQYRGTLSFGTTIARPQRLDREPIEDVLSGIQHLVTHGVADAKALGIAGHSHGAWLGPLIATRSNIFLAGAFAEGWSNHASLYELYSAEFNREIQERALGEPSLYARPQRYIELSPDLHFEGLRTAMLFEAGLEGEVMHMVGMPKAARLFGVPSEFFVYPGTGHVLSRPRLQRESADRILDWFLYWLCAIEDPDPAKSAQYHRWHEMDHRDGVRVRAE